MPSERDRPDERILSFLDDNGLLHFVDQRHDRELLILVYNGYAANDSDIGLYLFGPGIKGKVLWDRIEQQLASAPYEFLAIMNCRYIPPEEVSSTDHSSLVGNNVVLAALGRDTPLREQSIKEREGGLLDESSPLFNIASGRSDWSTAFLEVLIHTLEKRKQEGSPIPVKELYAEIAITHKAYSLRRRTPENYWPYCQQIGDNTPSRGVNLPTIMLQPQEKVHVDPEPGWEFVHDEDDF